MPVDFCLPGMSEIRSLELAIIVLSEFWIASTRVARVVWGSCTDCDATAAQEVVETRDKSRSFGSPDCDWIMRVTLAGVCRLMTRSFPLRYLKYSMKPDGC